MVAHCFEGHLSNMDSSPSRCESSRGLCDTLAVELAPPDRFGGSPADTPSREGHTSPDRPPGTLGSAVPALRFTLACVAPSSWPRQTPVVTRWAGPQGRTRPPLPARAPSSPGHPQPKDPQLPSLGPNRRALSSARFKTCLVCWDSTGRGGWGGGGWPPRSAPALCPTALQCFSAEGS